MSQQDSSSQDETVLWLNGDVYQILGEYQLVRRLGYGGIGVVFEALHMKLDQRVALKVLHPNLSNDERYRRRFLREMRALGRMEDHPNLIRARYASEDRGVLFLTMDLIDGADLRNIMKSHGSLSIAAACEAVRQAALGLEKVRIAGLVHRDIKPGNLILAKDGTVKVLDLGLAQIRDRDEVSEELTQSNMLMGTLDYQSPEQAEDPRTVDIRTDIYSLGCTLYRLVTGQIPYPACESAEQKVEAHAKTPFPHFVGTIPELDAILQKMVAKRCSDRYATPAEVAAALAPYSSSDALLAVAQKGAPSAPELAHDTPSANIKTRPIAQPTRLQEESWLSRNRVRSRWAISGIMMLTIATVGGYFVFKKALQADANIENRNKPPQGFADTGKQPIAPPDLIREAGNIARNLDNLPPNKIHLLLNRAPVQALWQERLNSNRFYDDELRRLFVNTPNRSIFLLGNITQPSFRFSVIVDHTGDSMRGIGICMGYRETPNGAAFQWLQFADKTIRIGAKPTPNFQRGRAFCGIEGNPDYFQDNPTSNSDIRFTNRSMMITFDVERHKITRVRVGEDVMHALSHPDINNDFTPEEYKGGIGLICFHTSCTFSEATLIINKP